MKRKDVFGRAIRDAFQGKEAVITIRRDDDYTDQETGSYYLSDYTAFPQCEKEALRLVNGWTLDLGCGAGRHSIHLAKQGFNVVGVDISQLAVEVAHKRGVENVIHAAAPLLPFRKATFETILLMFNNFGILGAYKETTLFLRELSRILRQGGRILASSLHPTRTTNENHLRYHEANRKRELPPGLVKIRLEYGSIAGDWFELLLASPEEMRKLTEDAGMKLMSVIGLGEEVFYIGVIEKQ